MAFPNNAHTHNSGTKKFNLYKKTTDMEHKTQKKQLEPKIVRTIHYEHAYVTVTAVLIFPLILQTVINVGMQSIRE